MKGNLGFARQKELRNVIIHLRKTCSPAGITKVMVGSDRRWSCKGRLRLTKEES